MLARFVSVLLTLMLGAGCGARSFLSSDLEDSGTDDPDAGTDSGVVDAGIRIDSGVDAGSDAGFDAGFDAPPDTFVSFAVECSAPIMTSPGNAVMIAANVTSGTLLRGEWIIEDFPPGGPDIVIEDPASEFTVATPFVPGRFALRFVAVSDTGEEASCVSQIFSVAGPPIAACPGEEFVAGVDESIMIAGAGFDDDGPVTFAWEVLEQPAGSTVNSTGADTPTLNVSGDLPGGYVFRLTVTDIFGEVDSCVSTLRVIAPPVLDCPSEILTPTREPVTIIIDATDDTRIRDFVWLLADRPEGSDAALARATRLRTGFTPDRQGDYLVTYTATDTDGLSSSCTIRVVGTPTPPELTCPDRIETPPLRAISVEAMAVDDGDTLRYAWRLAEREVGSAARAPSPANAMVTNFTPDIAGDYLLQLTVTDEDGMTAECETQVVAFVDEGLRVEVFWNTGGTDMDTHLANEDTPAWFDGDDDCFYQNCDGGDVLEWGAPGTEDNPRLDIDDTNGFGPENINIDEPEAGVYFLGVHAFSGSGDVSARIYCGGSRTEPAAEIGPTRLRRRPGGGRDFWRVARIEIRDDGTCTVTPRLNDAGEPEIVAETEARGAI
ncbi:MAG: hypothetical protein AAGE52_15710 [Myxococcota bacterium]